MTETNAEFHARRSIDEESRSDAAPDVVQAIAHDQLSKLHADKARDSDADPALQDTPLSVGAVDGNVTVSVETGQVTTLTPQAAGLTSDRLLARARDAAAQSPSPSPSRLEPSADPTGSDQPSVDRDPSPSASTQPPENSAAERAS